MHKDRDRRRLAAFVLWLSIALAVAAAIYILSNQSGEQSAELSRSFVAHILRALLAQADDAELLRYTYIARKAAHFTIYFLLGVCLMGALQYQRALPRLPAAVGVGALYAALDEYHQSFVPGRGPQVTDVLLDACGVAAGALLMMWLQRLIRRKKDD